MADQEVGGKRGREADRVRLVALFRKLWDKAVMGPGYVRAEWDEAWQLLMSFCPEVSGEGGTGEGGDPGKDHGPPQKAEGAEDRWTALREGND